MGTQTPGWGAQGFLPYTPAIAGTVSGGSNGNGTWTAGYTIGGGTCHAWGDFVWGSSGTTWGPSGSAGTISLPVPASVTSPSLIGVCFLIDVSTTTRVTGVCVIDTVSRFIMVTSAGGIVASNPTGVPFAPWQVGDNVRFDVEYPI